LGNMLGLGCWRRERGYGISCGALMNVQEEVSAGYSKALISI